MKALVAFPTRGYQNEAHFEKVARRRTRVTRSFLRGGDQSSQEFNPNP